jgi:HEXXH motif-containing protein
VLKKHSLTISAFMSLAVGEGDRSVIRELRNAQLSKHLLLLTGVNKAARAVAPPTRDSAAFRAGFELLDQALAADPGAVTRLLALPQIGSWAHHCLAPSDAEAATDFGYLAGVGAAAAIRVGVKFEIEVPVADGRVLLPGLGCLQITEAGEWIRLNSDGERLRAGQHTEVACDALVPDDGSAERVPPWQGTPLVRAAVDGQDWEVLLETADKHLHCFTLPVDTAMSERRSSPAGNCSSATMTGRPAPSRRPSPSSFRLRSSPICTARLRRPPSARSRPRSRRPRPSWPRP